MHILHISIINKPWVWAVLLWSFVFLARRWLHNTDSNPAYLPSFVLFDKSVEQLSSSEPSLHCNTPSQRDSSGTHSPLLHLNSAVWSHSGCSFFSPAVSRCRMSYLCAFVVSRVGRINGSWRQCVYFKGNLKQKYLMRTKVK